MWVTVIAVDIFFDTCGVCYFAKIAKQCRTEMIVGMGGGKYSTKALDCAVDYSGLARTVRTGKAD